MLGMNESDPYYQRALLLGSPKCPVPVFFRFPLSEVLDTNAGRCNVSDGNMQTNWAQVFPIGPELFQNFDFNFLYKTFEDILQLTKTEVSNYDRAYFRQILNGFLQRLQSASQQEFLVKDYFELEKIAGIEIIVPNENARRALIQMIGSDHIFAERIQIDNGWLNIFHYKNAAVNFDGEQLTFKTTYSRPHELIFESQSAGETEITDGFPLKQSSQQVTAMKHISLRLKPNIPFTLKFRDEKRQEWVIFENQNPQIAIYGDHIY
ncbi:hypothetical protein GCM10023149_04260 [Mucilaginibacter gynuensis]|uniref:DarT domain-containing protein n=2 Tax=Mucilaginibacter gynuensis TaxID=1302236 RepID=A0ABP8FS60_9SPHI